MINSTVANWFSGCGMRKSLKGMDYPEKIHLMFTLQIITTEFSALCQTKSLLLGK